MPKEKLPLSAGLNKDVEEIGLASENAAQVNFCIDASGSLIRPPGLVEFCDLGVPARIDGLYWWDRQSKLIAQCGGRHFQVTDAAGTFTEISGDMAQIGKRVYYADFGTSLYLANGGKIIKIPNSGDAAYLADPDAPTTVTHVAVLDKYLIALPANSERVEFSEVLAPESFEGDWFTPESSPDLTMSLGAANDRIELPGTNSWEGWRNDGVTPFVKDPQLTMDRGIAAPHSLTFVEGTWYCLDNQRKVIRLNGRTQEIISGPINKYIQSFISVSDAIGASTSFNGRPQYILTFPGEEKTLCFDIYGEYWQELAEWDSYSAAYKRYLGNAFCFANGWNLNLVGDKTTGKIYKLDSSDYQFAGNTMRSMIRTPVIHHGDPDRYKRSAKLTVYLKKTSTASDAYLMVRWRDNGSDTWKNERKLVIGQSGAMDYFANIRGLGRYRTRQYEFAVSDNVPVGIVSAYESFDWLNN